MKSSPRAGFTIIELVLVVSIILIMTSIIGPTFRITPTREVENTAHLLVSQLEMARTEALGERHVVKVSFDVINRQYTAYADDDGDDVIAGTSGEIQEFAEFGVRTLPDLVAFGRGTASALPGDGGAGEVTLAGEELTLDREGLPTPWGTMGTIYITHSRDADAVAAVAVASSGAFKAWRWFPEAGEWR